MSAFISCKKNDDELPVIIYGTVADSEGNVYKTVLIGNAWWMVENLRSTKFSDGSPIKNVSSNDSNSYWASTTEPCFTALNSGSNGLLYNAYAMLSYKKIAPTGWHVATDADWKKLESHIGMPANEKNQTGWRGANLAQELTSLYSAGWPSGIPLFGTNKYGFNALPGGCRIADGRTNIFSTSAFWWSPTNDTTKAMYRHIDAYTQEIFRQTENLHYGMSIRSVKD
jgi:uncharacterized protein (TIGR02145 family)